MMILFGIACAVFGWYLCFLFRMRRLDKEIDRLREQNLVLQGKLYRALEKPPCE